MPRTWPALSVRFLAVPSVEPGSVEDWLAAVLDDFGPSATQPFDDRWLVFFQAPSTRDRAAVALEAVMGGLVTSEAVDVADEDWAERSQRNLKAVDVGRVTIAPPWDVTADAARVEGGRVTVVIRPSMGFGTGHHATTRLCTALLQLLDLEGSRVLDIGTGSGVLALAARALGAGLVLAVDDDPDAIESARENLALNGVREGIDLLLGDFRQILVPRVDVVVANLTGGLLAKAAGAVAGPVAEGGALLISGVTLEEEAEVLQAFAPWMGVAERLTEDEWMAALLRRTSQDRKFAGSQDSAFAR